ncbi:MAG: nucleoside deaminase, partial [Candidatus Dormiibacterota bacterium]
FMRRALQVARTAGARGEVPVGAVAVRDGAILAAAGNAMERRGDATAHAEMLVLRRVARIVGGWRLDGVSVYATLEPCPMCAGAMMQARIASCIYAAADPKKGADGSVYDVLRNPHNNHRIEVVPGIGADDAAALLQDFFRARR